jgi:hypothetical protein
MGVPTQHKKATVSLCAPAVQAVPVVKALIGRDVRNHGLYELKRR